MRLLLYHEEFGNVEKVPELMVKFVQQAATLHGKGFVSYNVHTLVYLYDDYKRFGSSENDNCFSFESYLGVLKNCVRSGYCPLQQISFRAHCKNAKFHSESLRNLGIPFDPHDDGIQIPGFSAAQHFKKVRLHQNCTFNIDSVTDSLVRFGPILGQVVDIILWKKEPHLIVKILRKFLIISLTNSFS